MSKTRYDIEKVNQKLRVELEMSKTRLELLKKENHLQVLNKTAEEIKDAENFLEIVRKIKEDPKEFKKFDVNTYIQMGNVMEETTDKIMEIYLKKLDEILLSDPNRDVIVGIIDLLKDQHTNKMMRKDNEIAMLKSQLQLHKEINQSKTSFLSFSR